MGFSLFLGKRDFNLLGGKGKLVNIGMKLVK